MGGASPQGGNMGPMMGAEGSAHAEAFNGAESAGGPAGARGKSMWAYPNYSAYTGYSPYSGYGGYGSYGGYGGYGGYGNYGNYGSYGGYGGYGNYGAYPRNRYVGSYW
ncbi:hypothetical protein GGF37_006375 [Kickxella alabastrina]|nr:hypothetical protein GGF37_006375 [Kickxella alabastrina]